MSGTKARGLDHQSAIEWFRDGAPKEKDTRRGKESRVPTWPGSAYSGPLTICAIDLGANDTLAAYLEFWNCPGGTPTGQTVYNASGVRNNLVADLDSMLAKGSVALGLEGPCWGAAAGPLGPLDKRWFETPTSAWYDRSGGPAALKAEIFARDIVANLKNLKEITYRTSHSLGSSGVLWLWEAYVFGDSAKAAGSALPVGETWVKVNNKGRHNMSPTANPSLLNKDQRDAFAAVRHGFAANPDPSTKTSPEMVVPIVATAIATAINIKISDPEAPFLVVKPAAPPARASLYC